MNVEDCDTFQDAIHGDGTGIGTYDCYFDGDGDGTGIGTYDCYFDGWGGGTGYIDGDGSGDGDGYGHGDDNP